MGAPAAASVQWRVVGPRTERRWQQRPAPKTLRRLAAPVAAALIAAGCGPTTPDVAIDLVAALPEAELLREASEIDLGTPEGRPHLGGGWSVDETRRDGTTMVWAVGTRSELRFFLVQARQLTLRVRCAAYQPSGRPGQRLTVSLNRREVGAVDLAAGMREYAFPVAAADTVAGHNRVELRFDHAARPSDHGGGGDDRRLAARFDWVRLDGATDAGLPETRVDGGVLVVPAGVELGFFLEPGSGPILAIDAAAGQGGARLDVTWLADGEAERSLAWLRPGAGPRAVPLPDREGGPIRLGLRCVGDAGEIAVARPRVSWAPRPADLVGRSARDRRAGRAGRGPNVLIYLVDTLRADRLGCYGNAAGLSPNVDALAADGVLFERVAAHSSWTTPSVVSVLTGLRPSRHGVNARLSVLPAEAVTAAELLRKGGYETAGFSTNAYITERSGFGQGFDHFEFRYERSHQVTAAVSSWLDRRDCGQPFFLYVHTVDPHAPYEPTQAYRERFARQVGDPAVGTVAHIRALGDKALAATDEVTADLRRLYDAEVAENDDAFGALVEELRRRGLWQETLAVFLADHGEEFREHGVFGHGWDLYGEVLDVPLIVRAPGGLRGHRVPELVQQTDVLPTVLEAIGLAFPEGLDGEGLWGVVRNGGRAPHDPRPALSYMDYEGRRGVAVRLDRWKLIEPLSPGFAPGRELYDLAADPGERVNVAGRYPVRSGSLAALARRELGRRLGLLPAAQVPGFGNDTRRGLEALGYLR